jgi:hypothetical protein
MKDVVLQLGPILIPLGAVFLTWWLSGRSDRRKRALDLVEKQLAAFRQLKEVAHNVPNEATIGGLAERLRKEPELLNSLHHRLSRLLGLRIELVPYMDEKIASFIDREVDPLFRTGAGRVELKPGSEDAFARCCVGLVEHLNRLEKELIATHRRIAK